MGDTERLQQQLSDSGRSAQPTPLAQRLAKARKRKGWSQADLAEKGGWAPSAISHWETGAREPSVTNLIKLCDVLRVGPERLLGIAGDLGARPFVPLDRALFRARAHDAREALRAMRDQLYDAHFRVDEGAVTAILKVLQALEEAHHA